MLKTNSKKYQENFKNYILDVIDSEDLPNDTMSDKEKINFIWNRFINEYCYTNNMFKHKGNFTSLMAEWLSGLAINIPYTYNDIIKLSKKLLETETLKDENKIIREYFYFMAIQIIRLNEKLNK